MIDDKKIENAAFEYGEGIGFEAFIDGAEWMQKEFLKDLWHPISEEPKESVFMLSEYEKGKFYANYFDKNRGGWSNKRLIRWLNIDDLLPKEGGNHD